MSDWKTRVQVSSQAVKILVTDGPDDILKARIPCRNVHPRALLTLLEGLALWCGKPLTAVIAVDDPADLSPALLWSDDLGSGPWPEESALVQIHHTVTGCRGRRITGLGNFFRLRRLASWE